MDFIKSGKLTLVLITLCVSASAQDTLKISRAQSEAIFLKENLWLIAEKLNVSRSEAMVLQAKLWPNPSFTIDQVNAWATDAQTGGQEVIPSLGGLRPNQQFGFGIEQLILTAGKRKKLVALEQVSVDMSKQYFELLLRTLKIEFRNQLTSLQYLQFRRSIYQTQLNSLSQLTQAYQRQVEQGHVPHGEFIRLKALELEIAKNMNQVNQEANAAQKELKLLMRLPGTAHLELTEDGYLKDTELFNTFDVTDVIEQAKTHRPDFQIARLEETYFHKLYAYEKAQRVPDLMLHAVYDRGGNAMLDFIGFGVTIDMPVFHRNQGKIQYAQIGIEQSKIFNQQNALSIEHEIILSFQNLSHAITFLEDIDPDYETTLDELLARYTNNFSERNISLIEYLDFFDAYLENKQIILEAVKNVNEKVEELNYFVGVDLIK
jgi:outer membrane protein, heavy metal efflux system